MEYIYGALLLHSVGTKVSEANLKKVLEGAGVTPDAARVKALASSLKDLNIDDVLKSAATAAIAAPAAPAEEQSKGKKGKEKKEEPKEEKAEANEQDAMAGLSSLFG
ncbi:MAG: 50S ribosomal protein P1 [Candidatus Thermoplasmatota archaeon]|jgi:large subunit ribosomal protein L12|nr:50S ribosomal protein P1 [Candidatus Thermoplasmatota archaeon]MCL5785801.1 50S ribosomal protein P1 [Candidatus Thermoplasmatota archaeon]